MLHGSDELYNNTLCSVLGGNTGAMSYTTIHYAVYYSTTRWQYRSNELYNNTLCSVLGGNTGAMSYTTILYAVSWVAMSYSLRRGRENAAVNKCSSDIWTL